MPLQTSKLAFKKCKLFSSIYYTFHTINSKLQVPHPQNGSSVHFSLALKFQTHPLLRNRAFVSKPKFNRVFIHP